MQSTAAKSADDDAILKSIPAEIVYLPNASGTLVPVPAGGTVEGYVEWLRKQREKPEDGKIRWSVGSVEVTGVVDEEQARLKIQFVIDIISPGSPFSIALGMNEATLTNMKHTGEGKLLFGGFDRDEGYRWWVAGSGRHELEVDAVVPLKKQSASTRLLLSLPASAVSHLSLKIPQTDLTIKTSESFTQESTKDSPASTLVDAYGFGSRLDVLWQTAATLATESNLESSTIITARVNSDSFVLDAVQRLRVSPGTATQVALRLPKDFELVTLEGREYREHSLDPAAPHRVVISLAPSTTGLVTLNWTARRDIKLGKAVSIQGFQVEKARRQNGEIGLIASDGIQLAIDDLRSPQMVRMTVADWQAQHAGGQVVRAYRFFGQGFQLNLTPQPVTPYVVCEPQIFLSSATDELKLEAVYPVEVYRGRISSLVLHWPGWQRQNWVIEAIEPRGPVVESFIAGVEAGRGRIVDPGSTQTASGDSEAEGVASNLTINFSSPRDERFTFRLRARRVIEPSVEQLITVPMPLDSAQVPATLIVSNSENVEHTLTTTSGVPLRSPQASSTADLLWPAGLSKSRHAIYRLPAELNDLRLTILPQSRKVTGTSKTSILLEGRQLLVEQTLQLKVQYEPLSVMPLKIPEEIVDTCEFRDAAGEILTGEWGELLPSGHRELQLKFRNPVLGETWVKASHLVPLSDKSSKIEPINLKLVMPVDFATSTATVEYPRGQALVPSSSSPGWRLASSPASPHIWTTAEAKDSIILRLEPGIETDGDRPEVNECLHTVTGDESGSHFWTTNLLLSSAAPNLIVDLPEDAESPRFFWNRLEVSPVALATNKPDVKSFTLLRPPGGSSAGNTSGPISPGADPARADRTDGPRVAPLRLTITWLSRPLQTNRWTGDIPLMGAQLPYVNWSGLSYWDVRLPANQYLFNHSRKLTPLFRWQRSGLFWYRQSPPTPISAALSEGLALVSEPLSEISVANISGGQQVVERNRYLFTEFGRPSRHDVATISMPLIVFFGAGISLVAGFLILRVPALRQTMPLLVAAFGLSIFGLFQLPILQLLAQPVIVGLLFPLLAILLERWAAYRQGESILTLSTESKDSFRVSNHEPAMTALFASEESTQYRRPQLSPVPEADPEFTP
ncbi:MAG: hypothetical protein C0478_16830 [Planctomyces sp.]|nr:hypothetical protein [Planctomyces sp.]